MNRLSVGEIGIIFLFYLFIFPCLLNVIHICFSTEFSIKNRRLERKKCPLGFPFPHFSFLGFEGSIFGFRDGNGKCVCARVNCSATISGMI